MKSTSARSRTVAHMQQLLATATAVACTRPDTQTVTITPLPTVPVSADPNAPPPPPTASATFNAPPPSPTPPDPSGYLVVDMLPAPARCLGVAASSKAAGKFRRDASGVVLDLIVTLPQSGAAQSTFTGVAGAWPGQVVSSSFNGAKSVANVRLRPGPGASSAASAGVQLSITCAGGAGTLNVVATFPSPPTDTTTITFALYDF
jgi:hypothetical protein